MSIKAMVWAWQQDLPMSTKGVLLALADHADDDGHCWPGLKGIAEKCRMRADTVRYHIRRLQKTGLVESTERKRPDGSRMSNLYTLVGANIFPPPSEYIHPPPRTHPTTPWDISQDPLGHIPPLEPSGNRQGTPINTGEGASGDAPQPSKKEEQYPEWWKPMEQLPGYKRRDHSKAIREIGVGCERHGVAPQAVIGTFREYYLANAERHGWTDPVAALRRNLLKEIAKQRTNGRTRRQQEEDAALRAHPETKSRRV